MQRRPNTPAGPRKLSKFDQTDAARQAEFERKAAEVRRMMEMEPCTTQPRPKSK